MLALTDVTVRFGDLAAVDGVRLSAADGEVVAILGPSGCGKSTLLRAVAGLEPLAAGTIAIAGRDVTSDPPEVRDVGLAFQDGALFPHRTVAENVAFGPRMRGWDRSATDARVGEVLDLVDLAGYEGRRVTELSGGEAQRVALARAIASRPRLLMLDEPLGALDRALRDRLLVELPRVFADTRATVVYVTHDQDEALTLADRVAVMGDGRVRQVGTPDELWRAPVDAEVARFLGLDQLVPGHAAVGGGVDSALGHLPVAVPDGYGGAVTLLVLPEAVHLVPDGQAQHATGQLVVAGVVATRRFAGDHLAVEVRTGDGTALRVPHRGLAGPAVGDRVTLTIDPGAVRVLPAP